MREIKFRAWDGEKMHYQVRFGGVKDGIPLSPSVWDEKFGWTILSGNPVLEIMQFTGLYDKNGKEIYEGDIVRCHGGAYLNGIYEYDYVIEVRDIRDLNGIVHSENVEILGNKYENPELLEECEE